MHCTIPHSRYVDFVFKKMTLFLSLFFALFLARTSSIRLNQEANKHPPLQLPLYHVRHLRSNSVSTPADLPFSDALILDDARVKFLHSRLNGKRNLTSSPHPSRLIAGGESVSVPLNPAESIGIANYYTEIGIGSPPTTHYVVVDTGSSFSWIQCEPCAVYCHPQVGSHFDPSSSSTYRKLTCSTRQCKSLEQATLNSPMCSSSDACLYTASYGDQSYSVGYLSTDALTFGSESLPGFVFGCGQDNNGLFGKSAGLVGLAKNELSMLSQLSTKYGKAFAYCLPTASPLGKIGSGGFLSIGTSPNSAYKFTPMLSDVRNPTLFFVELTAISVAGKPLSLSASDYGVPTIIDSGTTISRLASPVYWALKAELVKIISSKYKVAEPFSILDACFIGVSDEISSVVPQVQLIFQGGTELNLTPQNVLIEVEKGTTCLSFADNSNVHGIAIIGNQQQQTFDITYDVAGSRIGFASGGCR